MKRLLWMCLAMLVACSAHAGGNPNVRAYISFDLTGAHLHHIAEPPAYRTISAYVCVDMIEAGVTTLSFRMNNPMHEWPGVLASASFVTLVPS